MLARSPTTVLNPSSSSGPAGHLAELRYRRHGKRLVLLHTEVPAEFEGHGLGGRLVAAAIDRAAQEGVTIVPLCPFARSWLERHTDTASHVTIDWGNDPAAYRGQDPAP